MPPRVIHDPVALRAACDAARAAGQRVGLVPTMGALHQGHLSLVAALGPLTDLRVLTIFVNPLQFAPTDDLERYPRTLDDDVALCGSAGVDLVFAPSPAAMYPPGFQTHVEVEAVTQPLEGEFRPGHFRGVTTVVNKLFNLVGPCAAAFGTKDYQQWRVLGRMVQDLSMPVEMVGCHIVREADGLALSSRNRYLSPTDRARALGLSRGLRAAEALWAAGERDAARLAAAAHEHVAPSVDRIDYVSAVDPDTLQAPPAGTTPTRLVVLIAAHIGTTRLIDNAELGASSH